MSINVTSYNYTGAAARKRKSRKSGTGSLQIFATTLKISLPFCIFFAAAVYRVMLTSQAETLNKESVSLESRIADITRESDNLSIMIEQQSGKNILAQVKKYNLDLHYPHPSQIKKLELGTKAVTKAEPAVAPVAPVAKQPVKEKPIMVTQRTTPKNDAPAKYR